MRLGIAFHRFGPYHKARIESLVNTHEVVGIELASKTDQYDWDPVKLCQECEHVTLFTGIDSRTVKRKTLIKKIDEVITQRNLDAIAINGWADNGALALLRWSQAKGIPAIMMSESNATDFRRNWIKELIKRRIVNCFDSALVGGTRSREYAHQLGMHASTIFDGYDVIDNSHFSLPDTVLRSDVANELGFSRPYFLASNRFIEKKNLPLLLDAYSAYRKLVSDTDAGEAWDLVLLGDGPLRKRLEDRVSELGLDPYVHFPGFQQYDSIPRYYWGAKVFVHTSTTEQWGLVINEAMAAGLPVIASSRCGSTADLIIENETGFAFDPLDTQTLTERMIQIASDESLRTRMSHAATRHIDDWGPMRFSAGMILAVDIAINRPSAASWIDRLILSMACR